MSREWFHTALGLSPSDIISIPDPSRRSYRILDSSTVSAKPSTKYAYDDSITLDELEDMSSFRLIEFGSLFGGNRLSLTSKENLEWYRETQRLMAYKDEVLESISEAVVQRLGGRHHFVGLHLRLGGHSAFVHQKDMFHDEALERTDLVFRTLLNDQYDLDDSTISQLLFRNRRADPSEDTVSSTLPSSPSHHITPSTICPSALYPVAHPLASLNTPLYIATDSPNPRRDHLTALFRNTFPCLFFLNDFQTVGNGINEKQLQELDWLAGVTDTDGELLKGYLEPFLEGEIAAKAKGVVGTPTSTFSAFVKTVLHEAYLADESDHEEEIDILIHQGNDEQVVL